MLSVWALDMSENARYNFEANLRGRFSGVDNFVYVVVNGSIIFSNRVQAYLQVVTFTNDDVSLNQGDFVDFTLTWARRLFRVWLTDVDAVIAEMQTPPVITAQPTNIVVLWRPTTFSVTATGQQPLSYQWQFNSTNLLDNGHIAGSAVTFLNPGLLVGDSETTKL